MVNVVHLVGRLGAAPEVREVQVGEETRKVANFSLAVSHRWRDQAGEVQERTDWIPITCWGTLAEVAQEHLSKGRLVYVGGRLQKDVWTDEESGQTRSRMKVVADSIRMLDQPPTTEEPPKGG